MITWLLLVLTTAPLQLASAQDSPQVIKQPQDTQGQRQETGTTDEPPPGLSGIDDDGQTLVEQECEEYPQTAEQADLCQQWRMAVATKEIERLTRRQVYATYAEVFGLLTIVALTLKAITQTSRTIARDRAWISFTKNDILVVLDTSQEVSGCVFTPVWENTGHTPARDALLHVGSDEVPIGEDVRVFEPQWAGAKGIVGPGVVIRSQSVPVTLEILKRIHRGESRFLIYSATQYKDTFTEDVRLSETCQEVTFKQQFITDDIFCSHEHFLAHVILKNYGSQHTAT